MKIFEGNLFTAKPCVKCGAKTKEALFMHGECSSLVTYVCSKCKEKILNSGQIEKMVKEFFEEFQNAFKKGGDLNEDSSN